MSKIKSPFLSEDKSGEAIETKSNSQQEVVSDSTVNNDNYASESNLDNLSMSNEVQTATNNAGYTESLVSSGDNSGIIEIKEQGRVLKWIIIILVVLLLLAVFGLLGYYLFTNSNKVSMQPKELIDVNNFEMKGSDYKARSIIVE